MNLSPDGGATPAPRREGNRDAQHAAYRVGMVFRGKLDIPVIDWRHYLEASSTCTTRTSRSPRGSGC